MRFASRLWCYSVWLSCSGVSSTVAEDDGFHTASESNGVNDESELENGVVIYVTTPPKKRQPFADLKIEGYKVRYGTHDGARWTKLRKPWDEQEDGVRHRRGPGGIGYKGLFSAMGEQAWVPERA